MTDAQRKQANDYANQMGRKAGGRVESPHDMGKVLRKEKMVSASTHEEDRARARGGRVGKGKKGGKTTVNVMVGSHPNPVPAMPAGPAPMPAPAMAPPPGMPPMGPQGLAARPPMPGPMARKRGGAVKSGPAWEEGRRLGTQVTHSPGKTDTDDMKRPHMKMHPKVVTFKSGGRVKSFHAYKTGGAVEAPGPGKGMGPDLPGGTVSGETRLAQAARAKRR